MCAEEPLWLQTSAHVLQALCSCTGGLGHLLFAWHFCLLVGCIGVAPDVNILCVHVWLDVHSSSK